MLKKDCVITIDRLYGSGGRIMGKKLSKELQIPFYDEEILKMASEESAIGEQFFRMNDEKAGNNLFFRAIGGLKSSLEEPSLDDDITSPENLFRFQARIIRKVAKEPCIIMGRCADYVLRDRAELLRVFIHADMEKRAERIVRLYGESEHSPEKRLRDKDARRRVNYKHFTHREWGMAQNYHVTLNSGVVGVERCVDILEALYRQGRN